MKFRTDRQTLDDLNLLRRAGGRCVYDLYNRTHTRGGAANLERMFTCPLADAREINKRSGIIQYLGTLKVRFPLAAESLDGAEAYLAMTDQRTALSQSDDTWRSKLSRLTAADGDYVAIVTGITAIAEILRRLTLFVDQVSASAQGTPYHETLQALALLLRNEGLQVVARRAPDSRLSYSDVVDLDQQLRFREQRTILAILEHVYDLDVFLSVAEVAREHSYVFPAALEKSEHVLELTDIRHPLVNKAVGNSLSVTPERSVVFLTGANMAGKSTFMKAIGIAFYLAHLGFPVSAGKMQFSVCDGLYTTINLSDDLNSGMSHFYAEVSRLKTIARELADGKRLLVMFDELFRGTNVRDACEGTVAVTQAFAARRNCTFVISTHIIEAGEVLLKSCGNIQFLYLPTLMAGSKPVYTYQLNQGITADRHGMVIINNERILEIIRSRKAAGRRPANS